jgi:hypothetical protein
MIKCFVTDDDLKKFYPKIAAQIWDEQSTYAPQIQKAADKLINEMWNREIDPRLCMLPLDLKRPTNAAANDLIASTTETTSTTGRALLMGNFRRLVVNVTAITLPASIKLQGNDRISEPTIADTAWRDLSGSTLAVSEIGESTISFNDNARWVRYISTPGTNVTYTVCLYENIFDDAIAYLALAMIFADFSTAPGDHWDLKRQQAKEDFETTINGIKFGYDRDMDGQPDEAFGDNLEQSQMGLRMVR